MTPNWWRLNNLNKRHSGVASWSARDTKGADAENVWEFEAKADVFLPAMIKVLLSNLGMLPWKSAIQCACQLIQPIASKIGRANLLGVVMEADDGFYKIYMKSGAMIHVKPTRTMRRWFHLVGRRETPFRAAVGADSVTGAQGVAIAQLLLFYHLCGMLFE